ncbi:MAG: serine/threonine-protein kinase [Actinomycetota bacterium]
MKSHVERGADAAANRSVTDLGIAGFDNAELIGQGGFGSVYRARQVALGRVVAIKVLSIPALNDDTRTRFERECRAVGSLSAHPHIVTVHDCGTNEWGRPYIVMDYMERGSLAHRIDADGSIPWPDAVDLIVKVCGAVGTAHAAGVLHRDIKPENILLSAYGEPTLADFGISSLAMEHQTVSGAITASLAHAAPELLNGDPPSKRSDIYAVASTLFTLLAGESPFARRAGETLPSVIARIVSDAPIDLRPRGIPDDVCVALEAALVKDPVRRPSSASELGALLRTAQERHGAAPSAMVIDPELAAETADRFDLVGHFAPGNATITGRTRARFRPILEPPKEVPPAPRPVWKRPVLIGASVAFLLAATAGAVALTRGRAPDESPPRNPAVAAVPDTEDPSGSNSRRERERDRDGKERDRRKRGGRGAATGGGVAAPGASSFSAPTGASESGTSSGSGTQPSGARQEEPSRDEPRPPPPPPPPAPPTISLYQLYNRETGEYFMTISGADAYRRESDGWRQRILGKVYSSSVKGTRRIPLDEGYAYVFVESHPVTEPSTSAAPIYKGTVGNDFYYTRDAIEAESYTPVGYVGI